MINKNIGRPAKVDYRIMGMLADALGSRANISEACRYAGISRDTYYRYLISNKVFASRMKAARETRHIFTSIIL